MSREELEAKIRDKERAINEIFAEYRVVHHPSHIGTTVNGIIGLRNELILQLAKLIPDDEMRKYHQSYTEWMKDMPQYHLPFDEFKNTVDFWWVMKES